MMHIFMRNTACLGVATFVLMTALPAVAQEFTVTATNLSVRTCPSTSCGRLGFLPEGAEVTARDLRDGWARIAEPADARCAAGQSARVQSGNAACTEANGITEGQVAEWVSASFLAPRASPADAASEGGAGTPQDAPGASAARDGATAADPAGDGTDAGADRPAPASTGQTGGDRDAPAEDAPPAETAARTAEKDGGDGAPEMASVPPVYPDRWAACLVDYTLLRRHLMAMRDLGLAVGSAEVNAAAARAAALGALTPAMAAAAPGAVPAELPPRPAQDAHSAAILRHGLQGARAGLEARTEDCDREFAALW